MIKHLKLMVADLIWGLNWRKFDAQESIIAEALKRDGCFVMPDFLDRSVAEDLFTAGENLLDTNRDLVEIESSGADERIYGADKIDHNFMLKAVSFLTDLYKKLDMTSSPDWFQLLGRITYKEGNLGSGSGWHRDSPFRHQFKFILYLIDVDESNGPFEYILGSHKISNIYKIARLLGISLSKYRFSDEEINQVLTKNKKLTVTGKKGTLLIADTRGIHRGKPLLQGMRMAITRYYFPKAIPKKWLDKPAFRKTLNTVR